MTDPIAPSSNARPPLIALEGIDGSGTTTQLARVAEALAARGHKVYETCEPSKSEIGQLLRRHLSDNQVTGDAYFAKLALLYAADRLEHLEAEVGPAHARGEWVISDRYILSSLVYQSLHIPTDVVRAFNQFAPPADLTIIVDVPIAEARSRRASRGRAELFDADELQTRLRQAYLDLASSMPSVVVDGTQPVAAVTADILAALQANGWS